MRFVPHEHRQRAKAFEQATRMAEVALAILDAGQNARISGSQSRNDVVRDRHGGDLRDMVEIEPEPCVSDSVDEARIARVNAFFAGTLEEKRWEYKRAGATRAYRMQREFDRVSERGAARARDDAPSRYACGEQSIEGTSALCNRKRLSFSGRSEQRNAVDPCREQSLDVR